jgi:hypothetical protein
VVCDGFEVPVIDGQSLYGCFEHSLSCLTADVERVWLQWTQRVHFLTPSDTGWEKGEKFVNQYADHDDASSSPQREDAG